MTPLLSSKQEALCRLAGHELDEWPPTEQDPGGALLCVETDCHTAALVAVWNCCGALREALAALAPALGESDLFEQVMVVEGRAGAEMARRSRLAFGDGEAAGDVLAGGAE